MDFIYLEPDEEITSIVDKIRGAEGTDVGLVVPKGAGFAQSVVNLRLVKEQAERLHKKISIITQDAVGRNLAAQVGLPVYETPQASKPITPDVRSAPPPTPDDVVELDLSPPPTGTLPKGVTVHEYKQRQTEPQQSPAFGTTRSVGEESAPPKHGAVSVIEAPALAETAYGKALPAPHQRAHRTVLALPSLAKFLGAISVIVGIILVAFGMTFFRARAEVKVFVATQAFGADVTVIADPSAQTPKAESGAFPAELLKTQKQDAKKIPATGKKNVGEKAKGALALQNGWTTESVKVPAGSTLASSGKEFKTTAEVVIPGAGVELKEGKINTIAGKTSVAIEAANPGAEYNVGAGKFLFSAYTGDKQQKIYGESSAALSGGSTREVTIVSEEDFTNASNAFLAELVGQITKEFTTQAGRKLLLNETIQFSEKTFTPTTAVGSEASEFELRGSVTAYTFVFDEGQFHDAVRGQAVKNLPESKGILSTETDAFTTSVGEGASEQRMTLKVRYEGRQVDALDEAELKRAIAAKAPAEAEGALKELGATRAEVFLSPRWVKVVPDDPNRIKLTIEPEQ